MYYRERRYPCRFPVTLSLPGEEFHAEFTNVSFHGAHATVDPRPTRGEWVSFSIVNLPIHAQVVRFGPQGGICLRFQRPLSKRQLKMISAPHGHRRQSAREMA